MKTIPLTQGKVAIVDDADFEYLSQFKWCLHSAGYAIRRRSIRKEGDNRIVFMHRVIMRATEMEEVDHRNLDRLDNSRSNLRVCDRQKNTYNTPRRSDNSSGHKGVQKLSYRAFRVRIKAGKEVKFDKVFPTLEAAVLARSQQSIQYHGEFSRS